MELYNLIIYKVIIFYIPQKNRNIKKKYYKKIGIIEDIPKKDVSIGMMELYKTLDTCYIIIDIKQTGVNDIDYDYYLKLNEKSKKMYLDYKMNNDLIKSNIAIKEEYFKAKYNDVLIDGNIVKNVLKDIDLI